jgi:hypothetical protein
MIEESDLFLSLAEIAGVFVGFGALIGFTQRGQLGKMHLVSIQTIVLIGLGALMAALLPVGLAVYGLEGRELWFWSSLGFLILVFVALGVTVPRKEFRDAIPINIVRHPIMGSVFWIFLEIPMQAPLFLNIAGINPSLAPAFYTTALMFNLFEASFLFGVILFLKEDGVNE